VHDINVGEKYPIYTSYHILSIMFVIILIFNLMMI